MPVTSTTYLIIGAGPAGLQMGYLLGEAGLDYLIVDVNDSPGSFFESFPRHRMLLSINKRHTGYEDRDINLRWDWNSLLSGDDFKRVGDYSKDYFPSADALVEYLVDFAAHYSLRIEYGIRVTEVRRRQGEGGFVVEAEGGERSFHCERLIVATGIPVPVIPDIPGIELAEDYSDVTVDPEDFIGQRVMIIGKGNSAFETADNLISTTSVIHMTSPTPLTMAWKSHFVGHLRAVNNNILDTYQLKAQNATLDAAVDKIARREDGKLIVSLRYQFAKGETEDIAYDRVITCTGFRFDDSIFADDCRPTLAYDKYPKMTSGFEAEDVPDMFFAGTLMQVRDYKKSASAFIHGFRYNIKALAHMLETRYHGKVWPHRSIPLSARSLTDDCIEIVNRTSSMWHQYGELCTPIVISPSDAVARIYDEMPVDYALEGPWGAEEHYYLLTMEYGEGHDQLADPFYVERIHREDTDAARESLFLHPVLRRYSGTELISEHHIIEDLEAEWREPEHIDPLQAYFSADLAGSNNENESTDANASV